jgi:hypothetical protein
MDKQRSLAPDLVGLDLQRPIACRRAGGRELNSCPPARSFLQPWRYRPEAVDRRLIRWRAFAADSAGSCSVILPLPPTLALFFAHQPCDSGFTKLDPPDLDDSPAPANDTLDPRWFARHRYGDATPARRRGGRPAPLLPVSDHEEFLEIFAGGHQWVGEVQRDPDQDRTRAGCTRRCVQCRPERQCFLQGGRHDPQQV